MPTPAQFGNRYDVSRPIARGGMAEVYLATDMRLDRPVAIKVLHDEFATNAAFLERFQREARAMAGLNHPNMVQVYDYGQEDGSPYIVMEYVRGKTMRDLLREQSMPPPERAAEVMADVAGALQYAHDHGIVHRDVKPANIMIDVDGAVKVTDFGIAQGADEDHQQLTQVGAVIGTAAYFSPEQAQGHLADARSDVYAMGCVLYELLCGRAPFDGETPWAIAYKHVNEDPVSPPAVNPAIPLDLAAVVVTAMQKDPARRYQSAAEMRDDLVRWLRGEKPRAALGLVGLAAGAAAAAAGAAAATAQPTSVMTAQPTAVQGTVPATQYPPAGRTHGGPAYPPPQGEPVPDRKKRVWAVLGILLALAAVGIGTFLLVRSFLASSGTAEVPDVVGMTSAEAEAALRQAGFDVEAESLPSADVEADHVIRTDPESGENAEVGSVVKVFVSAGPADVKVPDVVGRTLEEAKAELEALGFEVVVETATSEATKGTVVSQDPAPDAEVAGGSIVKIVVSGGPGQARVPDVQGKSEAAAKDELQAAGFGVTVVRQQSDEAEGTVISQVPGPSTLADKGSTVTITVSEGRVVTVPDVLGKSPVVATNDLRDAGLRVRAQPFPSTDPTCVTGTVCQQDPAGATQVKKDTIVTIFIGEAAPTSTTTTGP